MGNELSTELPAIQDYFDEMAMEEREYDSPLLKLADKPVIPEGRKDVMHVFRWNKLGFAEDVAEGVDPATDETMDMDEYKVELTEISKALKVIRHADKQRLIKVAKEAYNKMREQAERTANRRLTTAINADNTTGNNSFTRAYNLYANGKSSFANLTSDDYTRETDIQLAISYLIEQGHKGPFHCVLNPWSRRSLFVKDASFRDFSKQAGGKEMRSGTLGEWGGATIHLMHEPFRETLNGTETTRDDTGQVCSSYVFAEGDAYAVSRFGGSSGAGFKPEFFINPYLSKSNAYFYISYRIPLGAIVLDSTKIVQLKGVDA
jgi:N4-gp56 family major capsid protein